MKNVFSKTKSLKNIYLNFKRMFSLAWEADPFLLIGYLTTVSTGSLFAIAASFIFKLFLDELVTAQGIGPSIPVILVALLASRYVIDFAWDFVARVLRSIYFDYLFRYKIQNILNYKFYEKVSSLDIAHFENDKTHDLMGKAIDTFTWRPPDFLRYSAVFLANVVGFAASFVILIPYGLITPVVLTIVILPQLYLRTRYSKLQWSLYGSGAPEVRKLWYYRNLLSWKTSVTEGKIFQSHTSVLKKFAEIQRYLYELNKKPIVEYTRLVIFPQILRLVILFYFAYQKLPLVLTGQMSIGDFTFFVSLLDRLTESATEMILNLGDIYEANLYVNHYFDVLDLPKLIKEPEKPAPLPESKTPPKVEFKGVSFKYPGSKKYVLKDVSFTIEPAENIAIVGANGAGKTTLVKLLCRFYDVTAGEILIDGVSIKEVDLSKWYKKIGILFQEFMHYNFTVRENIMMGKPGIEDENLIKKAAYQSGAYEFIEKLPKKYNQLLGRQFEGGVELSAGQWQKLAIARAFYESAPLLILDEPTSAIDAETEFEIFNNLNRYYKDKTLFLVSHRFSTVRNADKIIVLSRGRIVETGDHQKLVKKDGLYARMFNKQALGYQ